MVIPALQCNQKAMQKLRPYYTDMHLCSATSKDRAFKKQVLSQHWYHVKRLRVSETETHWERHTKNNSYGHRRAPWKVWFIKSSRWPCEEGTVKVRRCAPEPWWQDLHSFFPELFRLGEAKSRRFQIGLIWFPRTHFGFSGANWKRSHLSNHFLQTGTRTVSHTVRTSPALIHPCGDSSAQNEIHHHLRSRA